MLFGNNLDFALQIVSTECWFGDMALPALAGHCRTTRSRPGHGCCFQENKWRRVCRLLCWIFSFFWASLCDGWACSLTKNEAKCGKRL